MRRNVWAVIRREYLQRVRSKWFIITTVGGPVFMLAAMFVPIYLDQRADAVEERLAVVDGTDVLYERLAPELEAAGYTPEEVRWTSTIVDTLRRRAADGEIGGFLMLDQFTLEAADAVLYATDRPSPLREVAVRSAVARAALEYQLDQRGVDAEAMLEGGGLSVELLSETAAVGDGPDFLVAYVGAFFLYMVILLYAVSVMRATLEEKTSRVVEVIISSMEPWHLMLGKVVGVGCVGLTQMAVWTLSSVVILGAGLPALVATTPELGLGPLRDALPGPGLLALFLGFFLCGFFIYSGLYAAVGAMCNTDEEAQQAQLPVVTFLLVPIIFVTPVIQNPLSPLATGLSLFPLFTPILMWGRVASGVVPAWQVALSFVLMLLAILVVAWVAGRIYKVGILMAGKRPTLPELWRWVREA
jgi:ABC-2 type transport system permease protein